MNMGTAIATTRRPQIQVTQRRRFTTTRTTTTSTTSAPNLRELEEQRVVNEVMEMEPHDLADAFAGTY